MKSLILLVIALLTTTLVRVRAAVPISGPLAPTFSGATYATHDAKYGLGGLSYWPDRTTLPTPRRAAGMMLYETGTSTYWRLTDDLTSWTQVFLPATDVEELKASVTDVNGSSNVLSAAIINASNTVTAASLPRAGGTLSGPVVLAGNASASLNPVPLQQLQAVASTLMTQPYLFTASGLTLTVGAGSVVDAMGKRATYTGGSISLIASYTNYIYLIGNQLVGFSRNIHQGGVYLGFAVTGSSSVTSVLQPTAFGYYPTRIPRFLSMQVRGVPQLVWVLGDSITQGAQATGSLGWANVLFSTTYSSAGRNVVNAANVTLVNYGLSGMANTWGLAFTGDIVARTYTGVGQFLRTAMHRTRYNNAQTSSGDYKRVGTPNHLKRAADLVIVGFGNGSSYDLDLSAAQLETTIQRLQDLGCEVVLHTEQPFYNGGGGTINNWAILQDAARMKAIADANCIPLVDAFGAMQWLHDAGLETTYYVGDHTHPNTLGHDYWAMLLGSVVSPGATLPAESYPRRRRSQYPTGVYSTGYGAGVDVVFEYSGTGVAGADPQVAAYGAINLNTIATGASTSANAYLLTAGQKINVQHGGLLGLGVLTGLDSGKTAVCHMQDQNGTQLGSSFTIFGSFSDQTTKIFQLGDFLNFPVGVGSWWEGQNTPSRLPCYAIDMWLMVDSFTGGATTLPVVGFICETPQRREIGDFKQIGTWGTDTSNGHESIAVPYTDTVGSKAAIPFTSDVLEVWCIAGTQNGNLDVLVDGEQVLSNAQLVPGLVAGAGYIYHLFLQAGNSPANHTSQAGYRTARTTTHYAQIVLQSAGASPVAGNRSLQIIGVNALNFE